MDKADVIIRKGNRELKVTERQYRLYYFGQGYRSLEYLEQQEAQKNAQVKAAQEKEDDRLTMDNTKAEIIAGLDERGIEYEEKSTKEELLKLLDGE